MKLKPKILEYYDKVDSSCSFWRGRGTNSELVKQGLIEIKEANWNENWSTIRMFNIAFFQRPVHKNCIDQIFLCKDLGLSVWIDLDDWKELPSNHPMAEEYYRNFDELTFKKILYVSDLITVTNERLYDKYISFYPELREKIKILPNAINDYVYSFRSLSDNRIIVYRGGINHEYDIKVYQDVIREVLIENPDWHFISIGQDIKRLKSLSNYQYLGKFELHAYFGLICNINPAIFIVPLKDNEFNRCKSNISWMEGTLAGAACICPDYFNDAISLEYGSIKDFKGRMQVLIEEPELRESLWYNSKTKIEDMYLLSDVNKKRMQLINGLL